MNSFAAVLCGLCSLCSEGTIAQGRRLNDNENVTKAVEFDVCSLMPKLPQHKNTMIVIEGNLISSFEVSAIGSFGPCEQHFVTDGYQWPDRILLAWPNGYIGQREGSEQSQVAYTMSRNDDRRLRSALAKASEEPDARISVRVLGKLVVGNKYRVERFAGRVVSVDGFGHLGSFPAAIVVKEVRDIKVVTDVGHR